MMSSMLYTWDLVVALYFQVCRQCWHSHPAIFLPVQPHRFVLQPDWHWHPQVRPFPLLPGSFVSHSICSKPSSILHPCWAMGSRCVMLQSAWLHMWMIQHDLFQWRPSVFIWQGQIQGGAMPPPPTNTHTHTHTRFEISRRSGWRVWLMPP